MIIQRSKEQTKKYYHDHMRSVDASGSIKSPPLLSNDKNQSIRIDQLFSPDCEGNIPKSVILSGDSGRGKSFTLQKIMLDWASGELYSENFDVIFLLHFDEVKCLSQKISLNELFSWSCSLTKDQISEILKLTPEKVLIFIDAIDEFSYDSHIKMSLPTNPSQEALPMDTLRSLMNGQILPESFLLVTTRSDADTVMNLLKGPQRFTEIEGFSERGVQEYFQNFFQDEELCRKTYESLKTNESLLTACSVPLLCWMVCFCLKKHFTDDDRVMRELKTNTSIYVHFVSTLLEYHDQSQSVLTMLLSLGHLAEEGMLDEEVSFNDETVYETGLDANSIPFLHKECRIQGFIRKRMLKFMHLSFQEFCIALFYMFLYEEESQRNIRDILAAERAKAEKLKILQPVLCMCENMRFSVDHLSDVGDLLKTLCEFRLLRELRVQEDEYSGESPRWSLDLSVEQEDYLLSFSSSEENPSLPAVLNISFTCPQSEISSNDWAFFLQRLSEAEQFAEDIEEYSGYPRSLSSSFIISVYSEDISSPECNEQADALFCFLHSVCDLKSVELIIFSLNQSWALRILTLIQACSSLQEIRVHATSLLLEVGLEFLYESLRDSHCTVIIEGPTISDSEPPGLDVQPLPVCQSCVHIVDSDQWVQVEPSVFTDEEGSEFRISTPAGRFECSRTRIRWVCVGDVTLQYRAVDGRFLSAELEKLQCEKIGPVIDVTVISGKLEEAHLPHYACLAESDRSLTESVKVLSVEDDGLTFESVELTRFHAKILQPYFSPKTVLMKLGISVKVHCDLLIFMTQKIPIILHVYFFPSDSLFKEKIKVEEKSSQPIKCPRPETPLRMMKRHSLEVPGASVQPEEIKLRGDIDPNFFKVKHPVGDDIKMSLSQVCDQKSVWTATIWKEELAEATACKVESSPFQPGKIQMKPQVSVNFDKVKFFDRNWSALIKSVENVNAIADKLLQEQVINEEMYSKITHPTSTKEESMREICSKVRKSSIAVKNLFISIIQEEEPSLLNELHLLDS
ncbi:hypothetical protein H4Q32_004463 [Labeo rohita]|uniref:NACHT domain-containing protein n=1 Tax=Labeo rohita TaxID=84645 RepID=A0ABQ8MYE3_LABRO|nr:hypothetical protein H4Q32_004463 [Labeo rohita]